MLIFYKHPSGEYHENLPTLLLFSKFRFFIVRQKEKPKIPTIDYDDSFVMAFENVSLILRVFWSLITEEIGEGF